MNFSPGKGMVAKSANRPKNSKYTIKRLMDYLFKFKWLLVLAFILTIASNLFALVGPKLSGNAIDLMVAKDNVNFSKINYYLVLMFIFFILSSLFQYILNLIMINISQSVVKKMRKDVFDKISSLPISYFDFNQTGDIISKMSYDIDTINTSLSSDVIMMLSSIITVLVSFVMMIFIQPLLVLIFFVTIPISILMTKKMSTRNRKLFRERSAKLGELNGFVEEKLTGLKTIKAYNQEQKVIDDFEEINTKAANASYTAEYYSSSVGPLVNFMNNLSLSLISVFGAILYYKKKMTLGAISSFILYSRKFSGPINETANIITEIQSAMAAAERVFILLDSTNEDINDHVEYDSIDNVIGNVEANNISFGYIPEKLVLKDVSFKADAGKMIAIVGPTGAGKTTLVNLLMRFYDLNDGVISLDNVDISKYARNNIRKNFAMVLQETWLFTGSIYENILYGSENKTKDDVIRVCKAAKIHNYIESLPEGYDTILTEEGINISKGQKQLLTIARAMMLDAKMLILDEATSNVDTKTEIEIQEAMLKLMQNKTCFVIAHRLSTIMNADLILVVKNGNVIEQGTHSELLEKAGFYNELYNSQYL